MRYLVNLSPRFFQIILPTLTVLLAFGIPNAKAETVNFELWDGGVNYMQKDIALSSYVEFSSSNPWGNKAFGSFFYGLNPFPLDYNYNVRYAVKRGGILVPLADVNNTVYSGEEIVALLDVQAEWRSTSGKWFGTPQVSVQDVFNRKDDYDWSNLNGCREEQLAVDNPNRSGWVYANQTGSYIINKLYAPAIFGKPASELISSGMACQGNTCVAPGTAGIYQLAFRAKPTQAHQRYWQWVEFPGSYFWSATKTCLPIDYAGSFCKVVFESPHYNIKCDIGKGIGINNGSIESRASIPEWTTNYPFLVTVIPDNCSQPDGVCNPNCPPGTDPDCCKPNDNRCDPNCNPPDPDCFCRPNDNRCDPNCNPPDPDCCMDNNGTCVIGCSPCDLDCADCCGVDGRCNTKCSYDGDCCVSPYCMPYCPGYGYPNCVIAAGSCRVTRIQPTPDITAVNPLEKVTFQAKVLGGATPTKYTWHCDKNVGITESHPASQIDPTIDNQTCAYSKEGKSYAPAASFEYKDKNGNTGTGECVNNEGTSILVKGVKDESWSSCSVEVSGDGTTYTDKITANIGDSIKAKVTGPRTESGNLSGLITWKLDKSNNIEGSPKGREITIKIIESGQMQVMASVKDSENSSSAVICRPATVDVKDTVKWNQ